MINPAEQAERVFKTAWFAKAAKKAHVADRELCRAIRQVMLRQCDDRGVYKKRLGKNLYRSIVVAKGGRYWVYAYLFAKQDRANIDAGELMEFRALASLYSRKTDADVTMEIESGELTEICCDDKS